MSAGTLLCSTVQTLIGIVWSRLQGSDFVSLLPATAIVFMFMCKLTGCASILAHLVASISCFVLHFYTGRLYSGLVAMWWIDGGWLPSKGENPVGLPHSCKLAGWLSWLVVSECVLMVIRLKPMGAATTRHAVVSHSCLQHIQALDCVAGLPAKHSMLRVCCCPGEDGV